MKAKRHPRWLACLAWLAAGSLACESGDDRGAGSGPGAGLGLDGGETTALDANASGASDGGSEDADRASDAWADAARDATSDGTREPPNAASADAPFGLLDPCNGEPALCDKTYDAVTYPMTHAAMAYAFPPFACPAQKQSVRTQLDQGIRALGLEAHPADPVVDGGGSLAFCLAHCAAGELPASVALGDVRAFLDVNPREVVTLLIEGGADGASLAAEMASAGLDTLALVRAQSDPWPTLQTMIAAGTRVVVFADVTGTAPPWMLPLWTYVAETGTGFTTPQAMTCDVAQGAAGAPLFLINEYLVDGEGGSAVGPEGGASLAAGCDDPALAHVVNAEPFITNRVTACTQEHGSKPTFVAVDDYDDGDISGVVQTLNPGP